MKRENKSRNSELLTPQLQEFIREIEAIKDDARDLIDGLNERQFNWHPESGGWSIAECLDHLNVTGSKLLPLIDGAIDRARQRELFSLGPFNYGLLGNRFIRSQEPPVKRRMKTFKQYLPPPDRSLPEVESAFLDLQDQIIDRIRAANGLNLSRIKIGSPVNRLIRFNLAAWFAATAAHERRHLWQARRIREHQNFPR
jgi:DinB superfamily